MICSTVSAICKMQCMAIIMYIYLHYGLAVAEPTRRDGPTTRWWLQSMCLHIKKFGDAANVIDSVQKHLEQLVNRLLHLETATYSGQPETVENQIDLLFSQSQPKQSRNKITFFYLHVYIHISSMQLKTYQMQDCLNTLRHTWNLVRQKFKHWWGKRWNNSKE